MQQGRLRASRLSRSSFDKTVSNSGSSAQSLRSSFDGGNGGAFGAAMAAAAAAASAAALASVASAVLRDRVVTDSPSGEKTKTTTPDKNNNNNNNNHKTPTNNNNAGLRVAQKSPPEKLKGSDKESTTMKEKENPPHPNLTHQLSAVHHLSGKGKGKDAMSLDQRLDLHSNHPTTNKNNGAGTGTGTGFSLTRPLPDSPEGDTAAMKSMEEHEQHLTHAVKGSNPLYEGPDEGLGLDPVTPNTPAVNNSGAGGYSVNSSYKSNGLTNPSAGNRPTSSSSMMLRGQKYLHAHPNQWLEYFYPSTEAQALSGSYYAIR